MDFNKEQPIDQKLTDGLNSRRKARTSAWKAMLALVLILGALYFLFTEVLTNKATAPSTSEQVSPSPSVSPTSSAIEVGPQDIFYIASSVNSGSGSQSAATLYKVSPDAGKQDLKVAQLADKYFQNISKIPNSEKFLVSNANGNEIFVLNIATGETETIYTSASGSSLRLAAVSSDGKKIAIGQNYENNWAGEIIEIDITTKKTKNLVEKTKMDIYQGLSVLGYRKDNSQLVVSALGGDAGYIGGKIYLTDVASKKLTEVNPFGKETEINKMNFLLGKLSPNANKWLYEYCPDQTMIESLAETEQCPNGMELRAYDFDTKNISTVYKNTRFDKNVDRAKLRTIMSYAWQNNENIAVAIPGSLLSFNTGASGSEKTLLEYDGANPQQFEQNSVQIDAANLRYVIYHRSDQNVNIIDTATKKVFSVKPVADSENPNTFFLQ